MAYLITLRIEDENITSEKQLEETICDVLLDYIQTGEVINCEEIQHDIGNKCELKNCLVHA